VTGYVLLTMLSATTGMLVPAWPAVILGAAGCALGTGVVQVVVAIRHESRAGERAIWALSGLLPIALAVTLSVRPDLGALSPVTVFGLFTVVHAITLLMLAARTARLDRAVSRLDAGCGASPLRT
jgi:uncharacterized membrane protein HdeD (DUF308 family)